MQRNAVSIAAGVCILLTAGLAAAVPRMSLTAGTPCATCHVNPSGGGQRTEVGFHTGRELALVSVHDLIHGTRPLESSVGTVVEQAKNHFFDHVLSTGIDVRFQWAHLGEPRAVYESDGSTTVAEPEFKGFPMQFQPYLKAAFSKEWSVYGSYSVGPETSNGEACSVVFEGQSCFDAALQYEGQTGLTVRAGMVQPSIGMRWDDHTILTRGDAAQRRIPIIAPNYAELGGEISYQPYSSIRGELGVFDSTNLTKAITAGQSGAELAPVSYLGRLSYLPHFKLGGSSESDDDWDDEDEDEDEDVDDTPPSPPINGHLWLSTSLYGSGEFNLINAFAGMGLSNGLALYAEVARTTQGDDYTTFNSMVGGAWAIVDSIVPSIRLEHARTDNSSETTIVKSFVASVEFFPVSFVEIRPEYRIVQTDDYVFGQPTVQLHVYY